MEDILSNSLVYKQVTSGDFALLTQSTSQQTKFCHEPAKVDRGQRAFCLPLDVFKAAFQVGER